MRNLCEVRAEAQGLTFSSEDAAKNFAKGFAVGTAGVLGSGKNNLELSGVLVCMGYREESVKAGAKPILGKDDFCIVRRLKKAHREKNFLISGHCVRRVPDTVTLGK